MTSLIAAQIKGLTLLLGRLADATAGRDKLAAIEWDMSEHVEIVRGLVRLFAASTAVAEFQPEALASFLKVDAHAHIPVDLDEHLSH